MLATTWASLIEGRTPIPARTKLHPDPASAPTPAPTLLDAFASGLSAGLGGAPVEVKVEVVTAPEPPPAAPAVERPARRENSIRIDEHDPRVRRVSVPTMAERVEAGDLAGMLTLLDGMAGHGATYCKLLEALPESTDSTAVGRAVADAKLLLPGLKAQYEALAGIVRRAKGR